MHNLQILRNIERQKYYEQKYGYYLRVGKWKYARLYYFQYRWSLRCWKNTSDRNNFSMKIASVVHGGIKENSLSFRCWIRYCTSNTSSKTHARRVKRLLQYRSLIIPQRQYQAAQVSPSRLIYSTFSLLGHCIALCGSLRRYATRRGKTGRVCVSSQVLPTTRIVHIQ